MDRVLAEFGARAGLGGLSRNTEGVCRLAFDGGLTVELESADDIDAHVTAPVGPFPRSATAALLRDMLAANYMGADSGGGALSLSPAQDELMLCLRLPIEGLTPDVLQRSVEGLLQAAERWRARLDDLDALDAGSPAAQADQDLLMFRI